MAKDVPLGMEFMNWQNVPSISEALAKVASGGGSPILKAVGMMLAGGGDESSPAQPMSPSIGQGVAPPSVPGGIGMDMNKPSGVGIAPGQFQMPNLTMPKLGESAASGIDVDGDGQIDNFWGIKK